MIRSTAALAATLCALAGSAAAADLSHLPGADAAPPEDRQHLAAADAAEASGDLAQAYEQLRLARLDAHLDPALARTLDVERDSLARRLADQLVADAHARRSEDHPALADKLLTKALAYRASAAQELRSLYGDPAVVAALGGTDAVRARLRALDEDEVSPAGLRWHLTALAAEVPTDQLDRQAMRLALLRGSAGDADADVVAWSHSLARASAARLAQPELPEADLRGATTALEVAGGVLGAGDADVAAGQANLATAQRGHELRSLGEREGAWSLRIGAWFPTLRASFSASATPDAPTAGFAAASASTSASGTGTGLRLDARWLREPAPTGPPSGYVWGGQIGVASASAETDLVLADADTSTSSLQGTKFRSRIGLTAISAQLIGGWRWALGSERAWSVQAHALAGAALVRESYGTRSGVVQGGSSDRTISDSGIAPDLGAEVELTWRPRPRWAATAALGVEAMWLPSVSSSDHGTLVSSTSTTTGTYHEDLGSAMALGPYLMIGATHVF
jgi:hypothetical protein